MNAGRYVILTTADGQQTALADGQEIAIAQAMKEWAEKSVDAHLELRLRNGSLIWTSASDCRRLEVSSPESRRTQAEWEGDFRDELQALRDEFGTFEFKDSDEDWE